MSLCMKTPLLILLLSFSCLSFADADWQLAQDTDGIVIYTRDNTQTQLKDFKAHITIPVSLDKVMTVFRDIEGQTAWFYNRKETKLLDHPDKNTYIVYSLTGAPWPVLDRDLIIRYQFSDNNTSQHVRIDSNHVDNYLPEKEDIVRIPFAKGYWELTAKDEQTTNIVFFNSASPGGNIPNWLADSGVINMPYDSLKNLRTLLVK